MTEFEKFWQEQSQHPGNSLDKKFAEKVWHAAQRAVLRTIREPPYVPKVGDKVRFLSLCHSRSLGVVKKITDVTEHTIKTAWISTEWEEENGDKLCSGGILGEVEKVDG